MSAGGGRKVNGEVWMDARKKTKNGTALMASSPESGSSLIGIAHIFLIGENYLSVLIINFICLSL